MSKTLADIFRARLLLQTKQRILPNFYFQFITNKSRGSGDMQLTQIEPKVWEYKLEH